MTRAGVLATPSTLTGSYRLPSAGLPAHRSTASQPDPCPQQTIMPAEAAAKTSAAEAAVEPATEAAAAAEAEEEVVAVVAARVAPSAASCWRQSAWNC